MKQFAKNGTIMNDIKSGNYDPPKGLKGKLLWKVIIDCQEYWIEDCTVNDSSYTGKNGPAIKQADEETLSLYRERASWFKND